MLALPRLLPPLVGLAAAALALAAPPAAPARRPAALVVDLDVAVPPGSPLGWGRAFPTTTPRPGRLFPTTPGGAGPDPARGAESGERRTVARPRKAELDVRITTSFGLVRILTWDLGAHLTWISERPALEPPPATGRSGYEPPPPQPTEAMYWICTAPLLRLMLHPGLVSRPELLAHLVEIGEPVLGVLDAARGEPSLRSAVELLEERIGGRRLADAPFEGESGRETMLARFVFEELLRHHAYDPEGRFAQRLGLLGEEVVPVLARYTGSRDSLLARNATAALARWSTAEAGAVLARLAAETEDPVVLVRALSALASGRWAVDARPLVARLEKARDDVERVALIGALGELEADVALGAFLDRLPPLRRRGTRDPYETEALIAALARYDAPAPEEAERVVAEAKTLAERVRTSPRSWDGDPPTPSQRPDFPDPPDARARTLLQLATIVLARRTPGDEERVAELVALANPPGAGERFARTFFQTTSLARVQPAVRYLYLEGLADVGAAGAEILRRVALDPSGEPALRGQALAHLPAGGRGELALAVLEDEREPDEMRIYAFEVLVHDAHSQALERARGLLAGAAELSRRSSAAERFLRLAALRALAAREALRVEDLLPLLDLLRRAGVDPAALRAEVRALVEALVERAAAGARRAELAEGIDAVLELVLHARVNARLTEETRAEFAASVADTMEGVRRDRRSEPGYREAVATAILENLLDTASLPMQSRAEFEPRVPLEEELVLALGRTGDGRAVEALVVLLRERENRLRPVVALALGVAGRASAARHLVPLLVDPDPFTRFCAYESLRHLTGQDVFADWLYGTVTDRTAAANEYARWVSEHR